MTPANVERAAKLLDKREKILAILEHWKTMKITMLIVTVEGKREAIYLDNSEMEWISEVTPSQDTLDDLTEQIKVIYAAKITAINAQLRDLGVET